MISFLIIITDSEQIYTFLTYLTDHVTLDRYAMKIITLARTLLALLIGASLFFPFCYALQLTSTAEYNKYVHTYLNSSWGNVTYIDKPIFPVMFNNSQIQIGQNWTVIAPLMGGHNYHVYCYGTWVNTSSLAKTDYDIYVFNPSGTLESSHTEAAGFPEHLGTTTNDALFTPKFSGNYSFVLKNDLRESKGAQQATCMIIENLATDQWHSIHLEGKNSQGLLGYKTAWAYEFISNASYVELFVKVPGTLDMYEARLYQMNDAKCLSINSFPLPWEPGLYGNVSSKVGGYNFESEGFRGVTYASCEHRGQSMFANYSSPNKFLNLYHLVLIAEEGSGEIEFMLKTHFGNESLVSLLAPKKVLAENSTELSFVSSTNPIESAVCTYTVNNWTLSNNLDMVVNNSTCNVTIPGQVAGSVVEYEIRAVDSNKNVLKFKGNYTVKVPLSLEIEAFKENLRFDENLTLTGFLTPRMNFSAVTMEINGFDFNDTFTSPISANGSFIASYQPPVPGNYSITASIQETNYNYKANSQELFFQLAEPPLYIKYWMYILVAVVVVSVISGIVYFLKFKNR